MVYFPKQTEPYQRRISDEEWEDHGPGPFRKLAFSTVEMAVITGILIRVFRAFLLTNAGNDQPVLLGAGFLIGSVFLFAMVTLHLGNFPLRHWVWRAPLFALLVAATELAVSAGLIALGREPLGTSRATFADWPAMAADVLLLRLAATSAYALALAVIVQWTRTHSLKRAHRL
ncbi:MAG TPA: hypothetical protein VMY38_04620 [Gemmatimonadaceae bacterium]|nr:hypothetical protein [Gemmatimonadaceae bacterium]